MYTYKAYAPDLDRQVARLLKRGSGIRDIAFVKEISTTTVMRRIRAIAEDITPPVPLPPNGDYEMDEMHTCVWAGNRRSDTYVAYAIHIQERTVVNFTVGGRDATTLGYTVERILRNRPKSIRTDRWAAYPCIVPKDIHISTRRKINRIERANHTLRTRLKRVSHNRLCQSKDIRMLAACLKIYFWG